MTMKSRHPARAAVPYLADGPRAGPWPEPPATTEELLRHIEALGQRVSGHVAFMCAVDTLAGTSDEAKEKAVAVFHERLAGLERELSRVRNNLARR